MIQTNNAIFLLPILWMILDPSCAISNMDILPGDCLEEYCYDMDILKPQREQMGTKSKYPKYTDFDVNREFTVPNCTPKKMWILIRHGARTPTKAEMARFIKYLPRVHKQFLKAYKKPVKRTKCRMCDVDINLLKKWSFKDNITNIVPNQLLSQGFEDIANLANNLRKMFPSLFVTKYTEEDYLFLSAREMRTRDSYYAFLEGLFGQHSHLRIRRRKSKDDNMLLKAYESCGESVRNSKKIDKDEPHKLEDSFEFQQIIRDVSFKLGLEKKMHTIIFKAIWDWCSYEQSWATNQPSPWCAVFSPSHYKLLDYREDISYYYKKSYGSNVNLKLACTTMNDMLYHIDNNDTYKVVAYFVHSTLMTLFLTAMGVFKDKEHLRADNFDRMNNRLFRSSFLLPLTSNLGVIKYDCPLEEEREQIMFLLNQKPMHIDWCNGGLCPLKTVKMTYAKYAALDCKQTYCDPNFKGFDMEFNHGTTSNHIRCAGSIPRLSTAIILFAGFFCTVKFTLKIFI